MHLRGMDAGVGRGSGRDEGSGTDGGGNALSPSETLADLGHLKVTASCIQVAADEFLVGGKGFHLQREIAEHEVVIAVVGEVGNDPIVVELERSSAEGLEGVGAAVEEVEGPGGKGHGDLAEDVMGLGVDRTYPGETSDRLLPGKSGDVGVGVLVHFDPSDGYFGVVEADKEVNGEVVADVPVWGRVVGVQSLVLEEALLESGGCGAKPGDL